MTTEVVLTGTGVPRVDPDRAGPGAMVRCGDVVLQFDAGRATSMRLAAAGVDPRAVDALFVTHHHSDHLTGLVDLVFSRWLGGPPAPPLPVIAPSGPAVTFAERMLDPWADDIALRLDHEADRQGPAVDVTAFDGTAQAREVWRCGDVVVSACLVHHEPVLPAVAYRVDTPDGAVVISGDTRVCDELEAMAEGADVIVHETFHCDAMRPFFEVMPRLEQIADYHADTPAVGAMAARLEVDTLVLTHLIPPPGNESEEQRFVDAVHAAGYGGSVIVGRDLTTVSLPRP